MISVEEAKNIVYNKTKTLSSERLAVLDAVGRITSENIISKINVPSFNNSAMDGFALKNADIEKGISEFKVIGEIKAGDNPNITINSGECIPIYTGAPIPNGTDTIVMVEKTFLSNNIMMIEEGYQSKVGKHIRLEGEQIKHGEIALQKGLKITPSTASYLSAIGETTITVFSAPKVKIITTGNELIQAGEPLNFGQIYESNSTALISLLKEQRVTKITHKIAKDTSEYLFHTLSDYNDFDLIILTGGISMGKYDLVADCLEKIGVEKAFHKVAQKPGKPLYFGTKENTLFFALPGNPAAVITSYYEYIYPTIKKMMGFENTQLKTIRLPLLDDVKIKSNRSNFLKGKLEEDGVRVLFGQDSHILSSFAIADCLIYLPKGIELWRKGEKVEVHILEI